MCFAHMRPPPFNWSLSSPNDFYMFISVLLLCFLLYHMSPRDSMMTCARISVPHLLGSFSFPLLLLQLALSLPIRNWSNFLCFLSFAPTCFFTSCPQLEQLPLFSLFCSNLLFLFLSSIGAASSVLSLFLQLSPHISPQPTLIDCKLLW